MKVADKRWYALTCLVPLSYLYVTVNVAAFWMIKNQYWNSTSACFSVLNGVLSVIMLVLGFIVVIFAIKNWIHLWKDPRFDQLKTIKTT
ncbi:hypothetical protein ACFQU5_10390 [Ureibacillus sp. GCM10028918]